MNSYKFINNRHCRYFPCHKGVKLNEFNCIFCFCPLYALGDKCGGNFVFTDNMVKDCSACNLPHHKNSYDYMIRRTSEIFDLIKASKEKENGSGE